MTRFQGLADQLGAELSRREVILDGEIVALDDQGRIDFWGLMRGRGALAYAAFDLLWLNGRDCRTQPLSQRKKHLERLIPASVGPLNRVPCFEGEGRELYEAACRLDLEGISRRDSRTVTGERPNGGRPKTQPTPRQKRRELFER